MLVRVLSCAVALVAIAAGLGVRAASQLAVELPAPRSLSARAEVASFEMRGANSCSAAACHNGSTEVMGRGREYALALERDRSAVGGAGIKDKHAQAHAVLYEKRAQEMLKRFRHTTETVAPERETLCLRCHVDPGIETQAARTVDGIRQFRHEDGVSCESCHGPSERWLSTHFRAGFSSLSTSQRRTQGMLDTRSVVGRVRLCVDCHVGSPVRDRNGALLDVNHALLAAGHPRLYFEFSGSHQILHKHWDYAKDVNPSADARGRPDFEARAWAIGQVAGAQAAVNLLIGRMEEASRGHGGDWPEFAEYDCFACHHTLRGQSWRQTRDRNEPPQRRLEGLRWNEWYYAQLPAAVRALSGVADKGLERHLKDLRTEMEGRQPNPDKVNDAALALAARLQRLLDRVEHTPPTLTPGALFESVAADGGDGYSSWDALAQTYLGLAALDRAQTRVERRPSRVLGSLRQLHGLLQFDQDSPATFDPGRVSVVLEALKNRPR